MFYKKIFAPIIIGLLLVSALSFYVWAEEGDKTDYKLELGIGYHFTDWDDYEGKVGEYNVLDQEATGPDMNISGSAQNKDLDLDFSGRYQNDNDYDARVSGDYQRIFLQDFSYSSFEHWLDHDDLDNVCGRTGGVVVNHEDFDAGKDYIIRYSEEKSDTTLNLPFSPGTNVYFNYHRQKREGHRQAMTISHCGTCHVTSHAREVNEETEDINTGISKKFGWLTLVYDYFHREFDERGDTPINYYDDPTNPDGKTGDVFDDRISYGDEALPYDQVPSMEKDAHMVKILAKLPGHSSFYASYVFSNIENNDEDLETDTDTVSARLTNNFFPGLNLSGKFKYLTIDNDDVFVDVNEPVSVAGPNEGYTWDEHNPALNYNSFDPDFIRQSTMSRDVMSFGIDARYQLLKKTSLHLGYEWEEIDRDNFVLEDDGDTETTTNAVRVGMMTRPHRSVKLRLRYKLEDTDNPFKNIEGAYEGTIYDTAGGAFDGLQYYERYDQRLADVSNQPTLAHEITGDMTWSALANLSLTAGYRYTDEENDEINLSDWEQNSHMPSISLAYMPLTKLSFNFSYIYDWTETEALAAIPVFDG